MGLLLPAVNSARESARRLQCCNNVKQMALACISYEQQNKCFPPSATAASAPTSSSSYNTKKVKPNWIILCLSCMDQQALYDEIMGMIKQNSGSPYIDVEITLNNTNNQVTMARARKTEISFFKCPSDPNCRSPFTNGSSTDKWGRCNYGANAGLRYLHEMADVSVWQKASVRGVMGPGIAIPVGDIIDGASNTVLLGELRAGISGKDARGTWAMGGSGSSGIAGHGWYGDCKGPNALTIKADDVVNCPSLGNPDELIQLKMPCSADWSDVNTQATMRSMHAGGVHCAFADGSTHWISDNIDAGKDENNRRVWDFLNSSSDRSSVSSDTY